MSWGVTITVLIHLLVNPPLVTDMSHLCKGVQCGLLALPHGHAEDAAARFGQLDLPLEFTPLWVGVGIRVRFRVGVTVTG